MGNHPKHYSYYDYGYYDHSEPKRTKPQPATLSPRPSPREITDHVAKRRAEVAQEIAQLRQRLEQLEAEQADWNKLGS